MTDYRKAAMFCWAAGQLTAAGKRELAYQFFVAGDRIFRALGYS